MNDPQLVDYYEREQITWVDWRTLPYWPVPAQYVFDHKEGDCTAIADFTALCLSKGGYSASEVKIAPTRIVDSHHSICVFEDHGEKFVMDNGTPVKLGIVPYDEYMKKKSTR